MHRLLLAVLLCAASGVCLASATAAAPTKPRPALQSVNEVGAPFHRQVRQRAPIGPRAQPRSRHFVHPDTFLPTVARAGR
jgi:hypothetical protein